MKERILEIINKLDKYIYEGMYEELRIDGEGKEDIAKEINNLTKKHYLEFTDWILHDNFQLNEKSQILPIKEQYQYWEENILKK